MNVAAFFLSAFIAGAALAAKRLLWLILAPKGPAASGGLLRRSREVIHGGHTWAFILAVGWGPSRDGEVLGS
jgi:hypothetical protein